MSALFARNIALPAGYWLSWLVTAQCCYDQTVQLTDGRTTVFSGSKPNTNTPDFLILTETKTQKDLHQIGNSPLALTLQSNSTQTYTMVLNNCVALSDPITGNIVGYVYDIFVEDRESDVKAIDFNDIAIRLVALKSNS